MNTEEFYMMLFLFLKLRKKSSQNVQKEETTLKKEVEVQTYFNITQIRIVITNIIIIIP